jgi:hypothetical protein
MDIQLPTSLHATQHRYLSVLVTSNSVTCWFHLKSPHKLLSVAFYPFTFLIVCYLLYCICYFYTVQLVVASHFKEAGGGG